MATPLPFHDQAQQLLARLATQCAQGGVGSMSPSIYDTAWVSMVRKPGAGWLFPECFDVLLEEQLPSGAWPCYATPLDGILNTAAALLALNRRMRALDPEGEEEEEDQQRHGNRGGGLLFRTHRAETALREMLSGWDVESTDQVGFEMLVVSLLGLLEKEAGVVVDFPGLEALRAVRDAKLAKLPPQTMYKGPSTSHHALEAFVGHVDFDRVRSWRQADGSMMGSPASTAAYLMNSSTWDDKAEAYLRRVLSRQTSKGLAPPRSVPCAWPTTIFEISWTISTLITAGVTVGRTERRAFRSLLRDTLLAQNGLLGFAPGTLPDVDDTAKGFEALQYLDDGKEVNIEGLIQTFETSEHFMTYAGERNASFSANCNVLILLLVREDREQHIPQITKAVQFLTRCVFEGRVKEKWHLSKWYWVMLHARALELLFQYPGVITRVLDQVPTLRDEIPMVSLGILLRIIRAQRDDGSWDGICEVSSYAILALASIETLPWVRQLDTGKLVAAMALGKSFLVSNRADWANGHHLWIEKVSYSSSVLSEAYCLAATLVPLPSAIHPQPGENDSASAVLHADVRLLSGIRQAGSLISRTRLFARTDPWALRVAEMQACFAIYTLRRQPLDVFPRTAKGKDKYLFLIPLALTASALVPGSLATVSLSVLVEMTYLSLLNFHADEYMECVVERHFGDRLDNIRSAVRQVFDELRLRVSSETNGASAASNGGDYLGSEKQPTIADIKTVLGRFVRHILQHPAVLTSPASLQAHLASELQTFLLAHIAQAEDSHRFRAQRARDDALAGSPADETSNGNSGGRHPPQATSTVYHNPGRTFYHWVRSTSADHTSCPFSFLFFTCLVHHSTLGSPSTPPGPSSSPSPHPNGSSRQPATTTNGTNSTTTTTTPQQPNNQRAVPVFASPRAAYLAEDACRHLAALCRMYNDAGSAARDAAEGALNAVNFPEFASCSSSSSSSVTTTSSSQSLPQGWSLRNGGRRSGHGASADAAGNDHYVDGGGGGGGERKGSGVGGTARDELLWVAEYERRGLEMALEMLEKELTARESPRAAAEWMDALRLFVRVTDLYGQVYVLKDVGARTR